MTGGPIFFLVAGEPSGDALGGRLMAALRDMAGGDVRFVGIGGPAMAAEGLDSLFPIEELSVMGLVEVLPHARRLFSRMQQVADAVDAARPAALITIDAPAFAHGVAKRLRRRDVPRIHYVAPQLWAWRPWQVAKIRRHFDHLLALLPFEPDWFRARGLDCRFVGHPVVERAPDPAAGQAFRARHGIAPESPLLCVLPGSRRGEVSRLVGPFGSAVARLADGRPNLSVVLPTVSGVRDLVAQAAREWPVPSVVVEGATERAAAMAASDAALAASGTVTLELAMAAVPCVVGYRVSPVTYAVARRLVNVRYASLINLLLDREVIPELLQKDCTPERLAGAVGHLLDGPAGRRQIAAAAPALEALGRGGEAPSRRAAREILAIMERSPQSPPA